jgi:hypothetical protein
MSSEVTTHSIGDNKVSIYNPQTDEINDYTCLNLDRMIVGVENPDQREVLKDPTTGYNYSRNKVEAYEIYNRKTQQRKRNWFVLELCTGQHGWFPGCEIHADILQDKIKLYKEPSRESEILYNFSAGTIVTVVDVLNLQQTHDTPGWRKVKFLNEGYIEESALSNFRYASPNTAG